MKHYCAFLRAINVGGQHVVKMGELVKRLTALGLTDVKTVIASGNVFFSAPGADGEALAKKIEAELMAWLGFPVVTMVRTITELDALAGANPFKGVARERDSKLYVTFMRTVPKSLPKLPHVSPKEGLKLFRVVGREAFCISVRIEGRFGVPNLMIEKALGVPSTTRNWNTVLRMHAQVQR